MEITEPHTDIPQPHSLNGAHRALNAVSRACFARHPTSDVLLPVHTNNLSSATNVPWGSDAHDYNNKLFRVKFQNMHGFPQVNDSIPSWASTMDFLHSL
jgi:hypothetical protein